MRSIVDRLLRSRIFSSAVITVTLVAFGGIIGSADSGTVTYSGCENVATGIVRLLPNQLPAPYNACILAGNPILKTQPNLLEVAISWAQAGPMGAQGAQGPQGPQGPQGSQGP